MSIGLLFWVLMVLWFFSWLGTTWQVGPAWGIHASNLLFFVLLFLLGWHAFGFVIHAALEGASRYAALTPCCFLLV